MSRDLHCQSGQEAWDWYIVDGDNDGTKHPILTAKNVLAKAWKSKNRRKSVQGSLAWGKGPFSSEVQNEETGGDRRSMVLLQETRNWMNTDKKNTSIGRKMTEVFVSTNNSRQQDSEIYLQALGRCHLRQIGRNVFFEMLHIFKIVFQRCTELLSVKNACEQDFLLHTGDVCTQSG